MPDDADIAVVGLGAAGLMASIWAGRTGHALGAHAGRPFRVVGLDGAARLGAKILVAGGGRCNVTHHEVSERDYCGSSRNAIKKVLRSFDVSRTVAFFRALGVELKREDTGKLFPVTDQARTVLDALLSAARDAGAELRHPARVERITPIVADGVGPRFEIAGPWGTLRASRVVLATGGMALPKTGSDGLGYTLARALGHTVTPRVFPALAPLKLEGGHFLCALSGLSAVAAVEVRASTGKRLDSFTGPVLCTHFGLSGPAIMNVSRHLTAARFDDPTASLVLHWLPGTTPENLERAILEAGKARLGRLIVQLSYSAAVTRMIDAGHDDRDSSKPGVPASPDPAEVLPQRLIDALAAHAGVAPDSMCASLTRDQRRAVVQAITALAVPVTSDRGFTFAEATAGGVPLSELQLDTMESRAIPGLHLCGEVCDVDGRIGGFNFQWAWSSGYLAGCGAARGKLEPRTTGEGGAGA